jgi:phosphatidylserine/phosphatidylglycerophosphate/cardiolipin synthase-like enzyme
MISLATRAEALSAASRAGSVVATAYLLPPGPVLQTLEDAARRGARVYVRVEGRPAGDDKGRMHAMNAAAIAALKRLGADAQLIDCDGADGPKMHMKALVCDRVAYLDDRNFVKGGDQTIVRDDDGADVDAVVAAAHAEPYAGSDSVCTNKAAALDAQGRVLASARAKGSVDVETESFSRQSGTYAQLKRLAARGVHCRLIVSRRELRSSDKMQHAVQLLRAAGVAVRAADTNEKFAIVDGARAWVGSADSTSAYPDGDQIDWSLCTHLPQIVDALRAHFRTHWDAAKPELLNTEQDAGVLGGARAHRVF